MARRERHQTHERLNADEAVRGSSDRSFGLVLAGAFTVIGLWPLVRGAGGRWWSLGLAIAFLGFALLWPAGLRPLNYLWFKLGLALHRLVSPLVLGGIFFGTVTPLALVMRALGKDPLRLRLDPDAPSYWIPREPPGPPPDTMPRQF
jgi:hypothetical protein